MSEQGFGIIVRSAFHSLLSVEIPPFLSSDFMYAIIKSAEEAGIKRAAFHLTNPVDVINSTMELKLDDSAISPIIGDMGFIEDQIYIARRGMEVNSFEKHLLVNAGDILCDLAQGKAHIIIKYGINSENENKVITVIYDHMETKLL
jgi:hypothetical protein